MKLEIKCKPAGSVAEVVLEAGEQFTAEVGAMIAMDADITVETTSRKAGGKGGLLKGIKRMFSGESFFLNHFTAHGEGQSLLLGPKLVGDIDRYEMTGGTLMVQGSSWLASSPGIEIDTTWAGLGNALFSGEGIFWVKCTGTGTVLFNSFGAIYPIDVDGEYVVDSGHIVAYEDTLTFKATKAGESWLGSFMGGEGLACRFSGKGRVYCQTHNPPNFGRALGSKLKPRD